MGLLGLLGLCRSKFFSLRGRKLPPCRILDFREVFGFIKSRPNTNPLNNYDSMIDNVKDTMKNDKNLSFIIITLILKVLVAMAAILCAVSPKTNPRSLQDSLDSTYTIEMYIV